MDMTHKPQDLVRKLKIIIKAEGGLRLLDKGPIEFMDLFPVFEWLKTKSATEVFDFVSVISKSEPEVYTKQLASTILVGIDDGPWTGSQWEQICQSCPGGY